MNPLYSVGQDVAVCSSGLHVVIPKTVITARKYWRGGYVECAVTRTKRAAPSAWEYQVRDYPAIIDGLPVWIREGCIRPINPDTEYLSLNTQSPVEVNA